MRAHILLILLTATFITKAQNNTFLITEQTLPYTNQVWFYSGKGNNLQEENITKNWNKQNLRITSAAYTINGWFVTMAKNTGIGMQSYSYTTQWPKEWIENKWKENYNITTIAKGKNKWFIVMSQGIDYKRQTYWKNNWNNLRDWIKKNWDNEYYITDIAYDGSHWSIVMSQTKKFTSQGYLWCDNYNSLKKNIKENIWDKGYNIHFIESTGEKYLVVYGNYRNNNNRIQSYSIIDSDISSYISKKWNESYNISYIGGTYFNRSVNNPNYGKRTGQLYFRNDKYQLADLNFYFNNGNYLAGSSYLGMAGYGFIPRYVLQEETSDWYIFYKCKLYLNGKIEPLNYSPKMKVSKDWNKIIMENILGEDLILTKEISKEEYDKIGKSKMGLINNYTNGGQINNNNNNNYYDSPSIVDGPCKYCGGGGGCSSCNGKGIKYNSYSGNYDTCPSCRGNKRCFNCRGTGKQATF